MTSAIITGLVVIGTIAYNELRVREFNRHVKSITDGLDDLEKLMKEQAE